MKILNSQILITGTSGFVGNYLLHYFNGAISAPSLRLNDLKENELRKLIKDNDVKVLIHTAAISDIKTCEENADESYKANVLIPEFLAKLTNELNIKLIGFSSDQVYSGSDLIGPYKEEDACPKNIYSIHKLEMENRVLSIDKNAVLLRAEWMYDFKSFKPNYFLNVLNNKELSFNDKQYRGLTYLKEVAININKCFDLPGGVYNFGSFTNKSMYEITDEFVKKINLTKKINKTNYGHNLWMDTRKIEQYDIKFNDVSIALIDCYKDFLIKR